jgi:hypothetical protein
MSGPFYRAATTGYNKNFFPTGIFEEGDTDG